MPELRTGRPRLDPHEVHVPGCELGEAADQPARRRVAGAGEQDRRLPRGAGRRRRKGLAAVGAQPGEAGGVSRLVLDALVQDDAAMGRGCGRGSDRRGSLHPVPAQRPHGLGGGAGRNETRRGEPLAEEPRALGVGLRVRENRLDLAGLEPPRRDQAVADRQHGLADDREAPIGAQRVDGRGHRALERVLDRHERDVHLAREQRADRVVHGRVRHQLRAGCGRGRPCRLLGERAGRAEVADAHQPASAWRIASASSGESWSSPSPSWMRLTYRRAWSRWWIEDSTMPLRRASRSAIDADWCPDISL